MAKKPPSYDEIADALASVIGGNDDEATVKQWLDTGFPVLNHAASARWDGGFPVGRMIEIAGPPSAGKTAIATAAMASAQRMGGVAGFMDHERSFSAALAQSRLGLDVTPGRFIYKKPRTFEESVAISHAAWKIIREKKLIPDEAPICWVFDSLAAMVPQSVLVDSKGRERSAEDRNMNDNTSLARATSAHFPALAMLADEYNVCCIFLNQLRTKIGVMYGDPRKTTGGESAAYYFSQRLWLSSSKVKKGTDIVGTQVTGNFVKNKTSRPFTEADWYFMFEEDGTGYFDREKSLIEFLEKNGHIQKGKPGYVVWTDGKQYPRDTLAKAIRDSGSFEELVKMLPAQYEAPVVANIQMGELEDDPTTVTETV